MRCSSILDLIYNTMTRSRNKEIQFFVRSRGAHEAPTPVKILYPVSRDNVVHSLLHLTRSTIRKYVRLDHIDQLMLPSSLKSYLKDSQYLYEENGSPPPVFDTNQPPMPPPLPLHTAPPLPQRNPSIKWYFDIQSFSLSLDAHNLTGSSIFSCMYLHVCDVSTIIRSCSESVELFIFLYSIKYFN